VAKNYRIVVMGILSCALLVTLSLWYLVTLSPSQTPAPPGDGPPFAGSDVRERTPERGIATPTGDWPQFLGPLGTSVSLEKGILTPWPAKGLRVIWHKELGSGYGAPSIRGERLYVFDRLAERVPLPPDPEGRRGVGLRDGKLARLLCLERTTGKELWKFEYPTAYRDMYGYNNGPRCCPVLDGEHVYLFGVEGMLHCLKADTGKLVWKVDTAADFDVVQNFFGVGSTPVVEGDLLIVQVGGSPPGSDPREFMELKGNGSAIVAFDKNTGKVVYKLGSELASYAGPVLATINGRRWCFVFARGGLVAFNPKDGKLDFHFPWRADTLECVNAANPIVVGDQVLITETYGPGAALLKVRPGGYEVVWSDAKKPPFGKSLQCHWMTPIYHEVYVYGSSGRHERQAELRCVELATGKVMWNEPDLTRSSLLMVDGHFLCLGERGQLRLVKVNPRKYEEVSDIDVKDPQTGEALLHYPCWAAPVLANGLLYIRGEGRLVCLELIPKK
jgi:outer membrane protein assembly factor BamB